MTKRDTPRGDPMHGIPEDPIYGISHRNLRGAGGVFSLLGENGRFDVFEKSRPNEPAYRY